MSLLRRATTSRGRVLGLAGALLLAGVPAALLRATCAGKACANPSETRARVPFCSLPPALRSALEAGFREGRSPDLFVVDRSTDEWETNERVPVIFSGTGVMKGASIPAAATLDRIAPTIAEIIGLRREHPDVRSGTALDGVASEDVPRLVLEVVWKRGDSATLEASGDGWPFLRSLMTEGAGSLDARPGSAPLDPAAVVTTVGTGGLPFQHGITGSVIRSESGRAVESWGREAPTSIIATLPDDLDETTHQAARIGILEDSTVDGGLVGGHWYLNVDRDDVVHSVADVGPLLAAGYGDDRVPDFFGAVVTGSPSEVDGVLKELVASATSAARGRLLTVFAATGGADASSSAVTALADSAPRVRKVVEATTIGGLFLDQARLARAEIREDEVVDGLKKSITAGGGSVDIFSDRAISFARYC